MRDLIKWFVCLGAASMVAACGGSGGGDSAPPVASTGKTWQISELIETSDAFATGARIAMDANGNAIAIWRQFESLHHVWANRYTKGVGWGTAQQIELNNTGGARDLQIAMDTTGNAIAVWSQNNNAVWSIWANRYVPDVGWGTAQLIETNDAGSASAPQIAMSGDGIATVVWHQLDGANVQNIWANRYVPDVGWGTAQLIETDDVGNASLPQIAMNASGTAIAVWYQSDGTRNNIWANWYTPGTGWGTASMIEQSAGAAEKPRVAIGSDGSAVAVWWADDGTRYNLVAKRYAAGAGWDANEFAIETISPAVTSAQIAMDGNGNAIAIWQQEEESGPMSIWANRYVPGSGWGTAELLETDAGLADNPQIAMDQSGNAMAVWRQTDADGISHICANRYGLGSGWGAAHPIGHSIAGAAYEPDIAVDANGDAVAVWEQWDGARADIIASQYH